MADYCSTYNFAYGLVNSVMRKYSDNWQKEPIYNEQLLYTPQMEEAIFKILDRRDVELFFLFSTEFISRGIDWAVFKEICDAMKTDFTSDPFNAKEFIWFCIVLAYYSALASQHGVTQAPFQASTAIMITLEHYRKSGEFTDDTWVDVNQAAIDISKDP